MASDDELVLGIGRDMIMGTDAWLGILHGETEPYLAAFAEHGEFRRRGDAEQDPTFKQIIPYLLMRDGDRIFLMKRTRAGGDARLFDRRSIGIGGHLDPGDGDVLGGLSREFNEEMSADWQPEPQLLGLLNDDRDLVGQVHLGVVFTAAARGRDLDVRETDKLSGGFASHDEVREVYESLETWSQHVFDFVTDRETGTLADGVVGRSVG
jgi:predicted NUDIX family phosphoesterase